MRALNLTNGRLAVGLDEFGEVRDFYWPVGENHSGERCPAWKIGLFAGGEASWLDGGEWQISRKLREGFSVLRAKNPRIGLALEVTDFVDAESDVLARNFHVLNLAPAAREIKLFCYQSFAISESFDGHDTAQFWPRNSVKKLLGADAGDAIFHFKGEKVFAVGASQDFANFSVGGWGDGREGSWRDAEDGVLGANPAERILTDSVVEFDFSVAALDSARVEVFWSAGADFALAAKNIAEVKKSPHAHLSAAHLAAKKSLSPARIHATACIPAEFRETFLQTISIAKSQFSETGAVFASLDTGMLRATRDAYVDCWPRDAANALAPFLEVGLLDDVAKFLHFAEKALTPQGFFWQMYRGDGAPGPNSHSFVADPKNPDALLPIQTDETAAVLRLVAKTLARVRYNPSDFSRFRGFYERLAVKMADFLCEYVDESGLPRPSYELWEVRLEASVYTTGLTIAALSDVTKIAREFGDDDRAEKWSKSAEKMRQIAREKFWNPARNYFYRGFYAGGRADDTIDIASLRGAELGGFGHLAPAVATFRARFGVLGENFLAPRFENDDYHGFENPWFIASFWLIEADLAAEISREKIENLRKILLFARDFQGKSGALSEQMLRESGPRPIDPAPLTWSESEFLAAILCYEKLRRAG